MESETIKRPDGENEKCKDVIYAEWAGCASKGGH